MLKSTAGGWRSGFSKLVSNWRLSNNAEPFSAVSYRRADDVNREQNREVMERVFRRVERSCQPRSTD